MQIDNHHHHHHQMPVSDQITTGAPGTCDYVVDSSPDRKPVQLAQHMRDVITSSGAGDEPGDDI